MPRRQRHGIHLWTKASFRSLTRCSWPSKMSETTWTGRTCRKLLVRSHSHYVLPLDVAERVPAASMLGGPLHLAVDASILVECVGGSSAACCAAPFRSWLSSGSIGTVAGHSLGVWVGFLSVVSSRGALSVFTSRELAAHPVSFALGVALLPHPSPPPPVGPYH